VHKITFSTKAKHSLHRGICMITIEGYTYRQNASSPLTFTFVRGVGDVTSWCGVPRKTSDGQMGYQRHLEPGRKDDISRYFNFPENSSPTSIVLGFYPGSTTIEIFDEEEGNWIALPEERDNGRIGPDIEELLAMTMADADADADVDADADADAAGAADYRDQIRRTRITFEDPGDKTVQVIAEELLQRLRERLPALVAEAAAGANVAVDGEDEEDEEEEDEEEEDESDEDNIEFGKTQVIQLIEYLQDPDFVAANEELIRDLGMPALVIDGQHRLFGAESIGNIPFTFVSILEADWREQVFQFCVINKCAKAVDDDVITSNAALSLTGTELSEVEARLTVAGFNIEKVDIMRRCFIDENAPFHGMVTMPGNTADENRPLLGSKQIVKLAKNPWRNGKGSFLTEMRKELYGAGTPAGERTLMWKESGDWARAFNLFWDIISQEYAVYGDSPHEPMKGLGEQHWGLPQGESNLAKTGCLQAITTAFTTILNESFTSAKADHGINEFNHPNHVGENAWQTLERRIRAIVCGKTALKRMLENHWTITQLNTSDNQRILVPVMYRHMRVGAPGTPWSQIAHFRQEGAI
jgi:hypothetical protein